MCDVCVRLYVCDVGIRVYICVMCVRVCTMCICIYTCVCVYVCMCLCVYPCVCVCRSQSYISRIKIPSVSPSFCNEIRYECTSVHFTIFLVPKTSVCLNLRSDRDCGWSRS